MVHLVRGSDGEQNDAEDEHASAALMATIGRLGLTGRSPAVAAPLDGSGGGRLPSTPAAGDATRSVCIAQLPSVLPSWLS